MISHSLPLVITIDVVHKDKEGNVINTQHHIFDTEKDKIENIRKIVEALEPSESKEKLKILLQDLEVLKWKKKQD